LKQIIARVPTTYTQDYAAPLPVVLQSKTDATTTQFAYDADGAWHANATRLQFTTLLGC